jgi:hypothetical protein
MVYMQLIIEVKESALDKVMWFLEHIKSDVKIIDNPSEETLDIEPITQNDEEYKYISMGRKEREKNPQNYGSIDEIKWG